MSDVNKIHFSHYKSIETLSCHSNESTWATLGTFQQSFNFIPLMASEEMIFEYLFANLAFRLPWQPIKFSDLNKVHMFGRGLLKEHFCKTFVKISTVTELSNWNKKHKFSFPHPIDAICEIWMLAMIWCHLTLPLFVKKLCIKVCFQLLTKPSNWATSWENLLHSICKQQRRRSACASAQSDQCLYCSLLK